MAFAEKFDSIKKDLMKRDTAGLSDGIAVQVTLSDEDVGGTFYIANIDGNFAVEPFDYVDNTAIVDTAAAVLDSVLAGKTAAEAAIADGSLAVQGNADDVVAVLSLKKKAPARKPAAKKTAAKKPAARKTAAKKTAAAKKTTAAKMTTSANKTTASKMTTAAKTAAAKKTTSK